MVESLVVGASSRHRAVSSCRCHAVASCADSRDIVLPRAWSPFTLSAKGLAAYSPSPSRPRAWRPAPHPPLGQGSGGGARDQLTRDPTAARYPRPAAQIRR